MSWLLKLDIDEIFDTKNISKQDLLVILDKFVINSGERIAQMIITKFEQIKWKVTDCLDETERGQGGYGHTGVK